MARRELRRAQARHPPGPGAMVEPTVAQSASAKRWKTRRAPPKATRRAQAPRGARDRPRAPVRQRAASARALRPQAAPEVRLAAARAEAASASASTESPDRLLRQVA